MWSLCAVGLSVLGVSRTAAGGVTGQDMKGMGTIGELGPVVDTAPSPTTDRHSRAPKVTMCNSLPLSLSRAEGLRAQH